jgi:hypothetical protein
MGYTDKGDRMSNSYSTKEHESGQKEKCLCLLDPTISNTSFNHPIAAKQTTKNSNDFGSQLERNEYSSALSLIQPKRITYLVWDYTYVVSIKKKEIPNIHVYSKWKGG